MINIPQKQEVVKAKNKSSSLRKDMRIAARLNDSRFGRAFLFNRYLLKPDGLSMELNKGGNGAKVCPSKGVKRVPDGSTMALKRVCDVPIIGSERVLDGAKVRLAGISDEPIVGINPVYGDVPYLPEKLRATKRLIGIYQETIAAWEAFEPDYYLLPQVRDQLKRELEMLADITGNGYANI